jgi:hypothetical protein
MLSNGVILCLESESTEGARSSTTRASCLCVCAHGLQLFANLLVDFEILGNAAVDADALAFVEVRLGVASGDAFRVACSVNIVN